MTYVGVGDLGELPDAQLAEGAGLIEIAEAKIAQRVPDLARRLSEGRTNIVLVRGVILEMVTAVLVPTAPAGVRSVAKTEGPYSEQVTYDPAAAMRRLVLTRSQLYDLGARRGAQTVSVGDPALARPLRVPDDDVARVFAGVDPGPDDDQDDDQDEQP